MSVDSKGCKSVVNCRTDAMSGLKDARGKVEESAFQNVLLYCFRFWHR